MTEHTLGPWIILASSPRQLKHWGGLNATETEYAANVRLGRAAPEMYDLLTTIIEVWDQHQIIGPTVYQDVRALLAKIEGQQS